MSLPLPQPLLMFTLHGSSPGGPRNERAAVVLFTMCGLDPSAKQPPGFKRPATEIFETEDALRAYLADPTNIMKGVSMDTAVALFDASAGGNFTMMHRGRPHDTNQPAPAWAMNACWGVRLYRGADILHCARFLRAIFGWRFRERVDAGLLPWGPRPTIETRHRQTKKRDEAPRFFT